MIDLCIVGSGISGSTLANLVSKKYSIKIIDKAKGPGGRVSARRYKKFSFDHGSHHIAGVSNSFKKFLSLLQKKRLIKEWDNNIDFSLTKGDLSKKFVGTKGNNDICKFLTKDTEKKFNTEVKKINFENGVWALHTTESVIYSKALVLTCPFPQSLKLLKKYLPRKIVKLNVKMIPIITLMIVFKSTRSFPINSIRINNNIIDKITYENSKGRFKSNLSCWTIQTTSKFAKKIINKFKKKRDFYSLKIIKEFNKIIGNNEKPLFSRIHGWKYAFNKNNTNMRSYWDPKKKLGLIGDWFIGPSVEDAWASAQDISKKIKKNPPKIN